ncbi:hypothetical protein F4781DRAFT_437085 [Annulohypoxylon bovei var. microspora]|nr:hypothetical protein F4781DRAFT_437085 [Annulohypoxylon bovei var. microspora]
MFNRSAIAPLVQQTRELHQDASTTLALHEGLRLHQASIKCFQRGFQSATDSKEVLALRVRMEYVLELLEFYETTCLTILEQQRNLLSLTFNLETVAQGRAVARLNALAIFFLPISFVASIFGITTPEASAYRYLVAAVPTLLLTAGIAFVLSRSTGLRQGTDYHSKFSGLLRKPRLAKSIALIPPSLKARRRSRTNAHVEPRPQESPLHSLSPVASSPAPPVGPAIVLDEVEETGGGVGVEEPEPDRFVADSNINLGYRVTGVARVGTNLLSPDPYANAAHGALKSPSGSLRHG